MRYIGMTQYFDGRPDVHPTGGYAVSGVVHTRVIDLENALVRVADLCGDRPAVLEVIYDVLCDDPF
jgi:hypothetical protein